MEEKKKTRRSWTAVIASYEEACEALASHEPLEFPLIAIPWGAERYETDCRLFRTRDEMTEERIIALLADAFPFDGAQRVHLISMKDNILSSRWGAAATRPVFRLTEN